MEGTFHFSLTPPVVSKLQPALLWRVYRYVYNVVLRTGVLVSQSNLVHFPDVFDCIMNTFLVKLSCLPIKELSYLVN